jgi:hypothetical protein
MRNQEQRDRVTVEIVMTLLVFTLVAALGGATLVLLDHSLGIEDGALDALAYTVWGCALVAGARYLWRHRRP